MKKLILTLTACLALAIVSSAFATITISANPSSQTVARGGTFNVTFSLQVTGGAGDPANVAGIDLFLQALKSQNSVSDISGFFSITGQTITLSGWSAAGPGNYSDALTAARSTNHGSSVVENLEDQALSANNAGQVRSVPFATTSFQTLTLAVAANVPVGTYTFTTSAPISSTDARGTHLTDSSGNYFVPTTQATFSITVVPEPSTWAMIATGALGLVATIRWQRRRVN